MRTHNDARFLHTARMDKQTFKKLIRLLSQSKWTVQLQARKFQAKNQLRKHLAGMLKLQQAVQRCRFQGLGQS